MWTFGIKSPKPLACQQALMSTYVVGFALFFFTAFQGMGAKVLEVAGNSTFQGLTDKSVVPLLMQTFLPPFMLGVVFMGAIAAIHSTAAPYIGTGGSILLRDVYWRYIKKQDVSDAEQIWVNRLLATCLTIAALAVGLTSTAALVILGALATAFGFVMYVLLLGVIWGFRFPSVGAMLGVLSGMVAVYITYGIFPSPLSMHCAFWGTFTGLLVAYLCKFFGAKDSQETIERQAEVRKWLDDVDSPSPNGRKWRDAMKVLVPLWYFFAIGPGCILGNSTMNFFGPGKPFQFCGFPSLWSWQIFWWILGIVMMWALCFKAEMSTTNAEQIARADKEQMIVVKE
jgi:Na+/proline symporter